MKVGIELDAIAVQYDLALGGHARKGEAYRRISTTVRYITARSIAVRTSSMAPPTENHSSTW